MKRLMVRPQPDVCVSVGDPMPRITLPVASGGLFDSRDPASSGVARVYWLGRPPASAAAARLVDTLTACETMLYIVAGAAPERPADSCSWLIDGLDEMGRAFAATGPFAIIVDAADRVAALLPAPTLDGIAAIATQLYLASTPTVVQAKAPVLLLERAVDCGLCRTLIEYWQRGEKLANEVGSSSGNLVNADVKRRLDVQLNDATLFMALRDCLIRRVAPAILQGFHTRIMVIEAPRIGCYDAACGGWFRRHRDNTSSSTAHRQFAVSLNLNADHEYDGGELRFPEFGRQLYRPAVGAALVFSSALLHEVAPVTRGRRFGVFTFLSASGPANRMHS